MDGGDFAICGDRRADWLVQGLSGLLISCPQKIVVSFGWRTIRGMRIRVAGAGEGAVRASMIWFMT